MTKNGHVYCDSTVGSTNLKTGHASQFAKYMVDVVKHFRDNPVEAERVTFGEISPINEPQWDWNGPYQEGCRYSVADIKDVTNALYSQLQTQGVDSAISLIESGNIQDMYGGKNYIDSLAGDAAVRDKLAKKLSYHSYWSDSSASVIPTRQAFAAKMAQYNGWKAYQTEYCILGADGPGRDLTMTTALRVARTIHFDLSIANVSGWSWWLALSTHDWKDGLIYVDHATESYQLSKTLFALGNYSRFIRPGFKRISFGGANDDPDGLLVSGYRNDSTGDFVAVYVNQALTGKDITVTPENAAGFKADYFTPYITSDLRRDNLRQGTTFVAGAEFELPPRAVVTLVGGTLNEDNTGKVIDEFSGNRDFVLGSGLLTLRTSNGTYAGVLSGTGGVILDGGGTLVLAGNNTYSGATVVRGGTLVLQGANASRGRIDASSAITIESGGTLPVDGINSLGGWQLNNVPSVTAYGTLSIADGRTCNLGSLNLAGGTLSGGVPDATWGNWTINRGIVATGLVSSTITAPRLQLRGTQSVQVDSGATLKISGALEDLHGSSGALRKTGPGTLELSGPNSYSGGTTLAEGQLIATSLPRGPVNIEGGDLMLSQKANALSQEATTTITALSIAEGTAYGLDLTNNTLAIDYTGASPLLPLTSLLLGSAGDSGIGTSYPNGSVAILEASDLPGNSFRGVQHDSTTVLLAMTIAGDANVDGKVDSADFAEVAGSFGMDNRGWMQGDFNYDRTVNSADFNIFIAHYGQRLTAPASIGNTVPEPLCLSSFCGLLAFARRPLRK